MTRKEFITNLLRDLGFEILEYCSEDGRASLRVYRKGLKLGVGGMIVWSDRSRVHPDRVSVKFKWCWMMNDSPDSEFAIETMRKARAWLAQRGFEAVVDWPKYRWTPAEGPNETGNGYLRIRSIGYPWEQCVRAMTKAEAVEDVFGERKRFRAVGRL